MSIVSGHFFLVSKGTYKTKTSETYFKDSRLPVLRCRPYLVMSFEGYAIQNQDLFGLYKGPFSSPAINGCQTDDDLR